MNTSTPQSRHWLSRMRNRFAILKKLNANRREGSHMKTKIILATLIFAVSTSFAAETKVSKEDRQKMADMHTKMAACLASDKPMSDCQGEMMKSCKSMMGKEGCPMMGHMKGMMKGGMMNEDSEDTSQKK